MVSAKIVADSIAPSGDRLTTLEVIMPRYILAELNTHRLFSKNSASSRAIPFEKMVKEVQENPFIPMAWQKDHKGMQGTEYFTEEDYIERRKILWLDARDNAIELAKELNEAKVTKQLCNRLLEPFMWHKVLISSTEWENFFNLRCPDYRVGHKDNKFKSWKEVLKEVDFERETLEEPVMFPLMHNKGQADIHMMFLAEAIYDAIKESEPKQLKEGEWHIPYGDNMDFTQLVVLGIDKGLLEQKENIEDYYNQDDEDVVDTLRNKISIARCARLSYQTLGDNPEINYEKDLELYETLVKSGHASPTEHVAVVMNDDQYHYYTKTKPLHGGVYTERGWCRNFRGFIQYRALID